MKKLLSVICFILCVININAQSFSSSIKPSTAEDYVVLLQENGYMSYYADVSSLLNEKDVFWIEPVIQHYVNGEMQEYPFNFGIKFSNRDSHTICEKVSVGFAPDTNKSVRLLKFFVTESGTISLPLIFNKQKDTETGEVSNKYGYRPFCIESIQLNTFIPIAMCGTYWYDKDVEGMQRFCGEYVLTPNMSENILKSVPEYYIIGMKISK